MANVYVVKDDFRSERMTEVLCKDESKELQTLLRNNFNLLPGDQIEPDSPCRWMLIKREMPVPDPYTAVNRWNIDFLFVDQNATPTFVECKRYLDTRSRREVIGQVFEYVANAQYFGRATTF
jgi:transposase InsO family protein